MGSLAELHEIMKFVEAGRLRPVVDRVLLLADVAEGHRILEAREAFGKIVFERDHPRWGGACATDRQNAAHAKLGHLLFVQHADAGMIGIFNITQ